MLFFQKKIRIEFESNYLSNASNEVTLKLLCIRHTLITNSLNIIFEELHNRRREKVLDPLKIMSVFLIQKDYSFFKHISSVVGDSENRFLAKKVLQYVLES